MANFTPNVNLEKPLGSEHYLIPKFNANMDKIDAEFDNKVDKELDKGLSSNDYTDAEKTKLSQIEAGANNYAHPVSHLPSIIEQDANNRFVTDAEKAAWNSKAPIANPTFTGLITTGGQIKFPATQVPSSDPNTLDDYEEGTFTPIVIGLTTPGTGQAYSVQIGKYIKVGENVQIWGRVIMTNKGNPTGPILIGGLPFSSSFLGRTKAIIVIINSVTATTLDNVHGSYVSAQNVIIANSSGLAIDCTQLTNTSQFDFYASYPAA